MAGAGLVWGLLRDFETTAFAKVHFQLYKRGRYEDRSVSQHPGHVTILTMEEQMAHWADAAANCWLQKR